MALTTTALGAIEASAPPLVAATFAAAHQRLARDLPPVLVELRRGIFANVAACDRVGFDLHAEEIKDAAGLPRLIFVGAVAVLRAVAPGAYAASHLLFLHHHSAAEQAIRYGNRGVNGAGRHDQRVPRD